MNTNGRVIFWMLFAVALGYGVNPSIGALTLVVVLGVLNKKRVADAARALTDATRSLGDATLRLQDTIAGVLPRADDGEDDDNQNVTVLQEERHPTPSDGDLAQSVTVLHINKNNKSTVTLPPPSVFDPQSARPSPYAVPLGYDQTGAYRWLDFASDALHIGLYGTSGCGKDHLLRVWFIALLDTPSIKWMILDGKGDWLTPNLARLPQMLYPPAGGYGEDGQRRILDAIRYVNEEAARRFGLLTKTGMRSVDDYNKIAGTDALPLLIVLITDVIDVIDETERLLISLVSKARALGVRVVVSMQTPTGKRTEWRMNLSTVLSGALIDGSQDAPALGVRDVATLRFRPSQLPPPPGERGVFVVRHNNEQFLVRSPLLSQDFDALVDDFNNKMLLATLLSPESGWDFGDTGDAEDATTWDTGDAEDAEDAEDATTWDTGDTGDAENITHTDTKNEKNGILITWDVGDVGDAVPTDAENRGFLASGDAGTRDAGTLGRWDVGDAGTLGHWDVGDAGDAGDTTGIDRVNVLVTLIRAGITREQARLLGLKFRNDEWAEAKKRHSTL